MTRPIELIARAVIVADGHVLLAHMKGAPNTYLPGGHIEFGERAHAALAREIDEELGLAVKVGRFLGAVENAWDDAHGAHHELNLVFVADFPGVASPVQLSAREPHLEFLWQPLDRLGEAGVLPEVLRTIVLEWITRGLDIGQVGWASTLR